MLYPACVVSVMRWLFLKIVGKYATISARMEMKVDNEVATIFGSNLLNSALFKWSLAESQFQHLILSQRTWLFEKQLRVTNMYDYLNTCLQLYQKEYFLDELWPELAKLEKLPEYFYMHCPVYVIGEAWEYIPTAVKRIKNTEGKKIVTIQEDKAASTLLQNPKTTFEKFTNLYYHGVVFKDTYEINSEQELLELLGRNPESLNFPKIFSGYYDNYFPEQFYSESFLPSTSQSILQIFDQQEVFSLKLENKLAIIYLRLLALMELPFLYLNYKDEKIPIPPITNLQEKLSLDMDLNYQSYEAKDKEIQAYFMKLAKKYQQVDQYRLLYEQVIEHDLTKMVMDQENGIEMLKRFLRVWW